MIDTLSRFSAKIKIPDNVWTFSVITDFQFERVDKLVSDVGDVEGVVVVKGDV